MAVVAIPTAAQAQLGDASAGGRAQSEGVAEGIGVTVGDRVVLHPYAGTAFGYVSNVFYEESGAENGSAFWDLIAGLTVESKIKQLGGTIYKKVDYSGGLNFRYREYLTSQDVIQTQRALGINGLFRADFFPGRTWNGFVSDGLIRSTRSPNFETSDNLLRVVNTATAGIKWQPQGNTLSGELNYRNTVDLFESDSVSFANRIQHLFTLRANWQWLPVTRFYFQGSQGIYSGLGDNTYAGQTYKQTSLPLNLQLGIESAITELTTVQAYFGYAWGFYDNGASYSASYYPNIFGTSFNWQYSPLGRFSLGFKRRFDDSINSNYYGDYAFIATIDQQIDRFSVTGRTQYIRRRYEGIPDAISAMTDVRDDNVFQVGATLNFHLAQRIAFNLSYDFGLVDTNFRGAAGMAMDDPGYTRHQVIVGAHTAY